MTEGRLGMIDARDIGELAAKVLTEEGHEGKTYTLTGPKAISFHDIAEMLSEVLRVRFNTSRTTETGGEGQ